MSKKTLLEIVQNILSAMDGDEVNSISDSVESMQVAEEVRNSYEDLVATLTLPRRQALIHLDSLSNTATPNYLAIPDGVKDIMWIRYNTNKIQYLPQEKFIEYIYETQQGATLEVTDPFAGISYLIWNNQDPTYFTSFDQENLAFNGFNQSVEATLQSTNSVAFAEMSNPFLLQDDFIADLPDDMFPTFIAEAKNACFVNMKQVSNAVESARARRGIVRMQNEFYRTSRGNPIDRLPDYGRRR